MGSFILLDARLFSGAADLTGKLNKIELSPEVEEKDITNFASGGHRTLLGGLSMATLDAEGHWSAGDPGQPDDESWSSLAQLGAVTMCPDGAAVEDVAWILRGLRSTYTLGAPVGDVAPWTGHVVSDWPLTRGRIAHPPGLPRTATGDGSPVQLGAVASGRSLYASLHVLSVAGTSTPTLTAEIQSDDAGGFVSGTDRINFAPMTAPGSQIMRAAGPISDEFFRASWTISGTTPSFLFVVAFGIA